MSRRSKLETCISVVVYPMELSLTSPFLGQCQNFSDRVWHSSSTWVGTRKDRRPIGKGLFNIVNMVGEAAVIFNNAHPEQLVAVVSSGLHQHQSRSNSVGRAVRNVRRRGEIPRNTQALFGRFSFQWRVVDLQEI